MQLSGNLKSQKWALKRNIFMTYKWNQNNNLCHTAKECVISNNTPLVKISSDLSPFCFRGNFLSKIENKQLNNISCITTEDHSTKTTGRRLCMSSLRSAKNLTAMSNSILPFSTKRQLSS